MSMRAGNLLWNRKRISVAPGAGPGNLIDTGIWQTDRSFGSDSIGEPEMPEVGATVNTHPSRLQVIPMAPLTHWGHLTHGQPHATVNMDGTTTLKVQFANDDGVNTYVVNVLFWNPATKVGPGEAALY